MNNHSDTKSSLGQLLKVFGVPTIPEFKAKLARTIRKYHLRGEPDRTLRKYKRRAESEHRKDYRTIKSMFLGSLYSMNPQKV